MALETSARDALMDTAKIALGALKFLRKGSTPDNAYQSMTAFIESYGFDVAQVVDRRTGGMPESVIGHDHYWKFLVATRRH